MTQDLYYYEEGYFDPALGYFVYTADAESLEVGTFTMTAAVGVIRAASVSLTSEFTQTAVISHIEGADLFAMTNASLAAEVSRIRDNNVAVTAAFTQVTAGAKFIHFSSDQFIDTTISAVNTRVRFNQAALSAAFSSTASGDITAGGVVEEGAAALVSHFDIDAKGTRKKNIIDCDVSAEFTQTTDANRLRGLESTLLETTAFQTLQLSIIKQGTASLSSQFTQTAIISHIEGADLSAFTNASQTALGNKTADAVSTLSVNASLAASAGKIKVGSISLTSQSQLSFSGFITNKRPRNLVQTGSLITTSTTEKVLGTHSLYIPNAAGSSDFVRTNATSDFTIPSSTDFIIEFYFRPSQFGVDNFISIVDNGDNQQLGIGRYNIADNASQPSIRAQWVDVNNQAQSQNHTTVLSGIVSGNDDWIYVRFARSSTSLTLTLRSRNESTLVWSSASTVTRTYSGQIGYSLTNLRLKFGSPNSNGFGGYIDEFYIAKGTGTSQQFISGAPERNTLGNDPTTLALYHFDGDYLDDINGISRATAALSTAFTQSVQAQATTNFSSTITSTASQITQANADFTTGAGLSANGFVASIVGRIRPEVADLTATTSLSATVGKLVLGASDVTAQATLSVVGLKIEQSAVTLTSTATSSATAKRFRAVTSNLTSTFTLVVQETVYDTGETLSVSNVDSLLHFSEIPLIDVFAAGTPQVFSAPPAGLTLTTGKFGQTIDWPSEDNSLLVLNAVNFDIPGNFIYEVWYKHGGDISNFGLNDGRVMSLEDSSNPLKSGLNSFPGIAIYSTAFHNFTGKLWGLSEGQLYLNWDTTTASAPPADRVVNHIVTTTYTHLLLSRSGSTYYFFVDGLLKNTFTSTQSFSGPVTMRLGSGGYYGYRDEWRLRKNQSVTSNFTPETQPYFPPRQTFIKFSYGFFGANTTLTVSALKVKMVVAPLTIESTVNVTATSNKVSQVAATSSTNLTVSATMVKRAQSTLTINSSLSVVISRTRLASSSLSSNVSVIANALRLRSTIINVNANFSQTNQLDRFRHFNSALTSEVTVNATVLRIKQISADFTAFYSELTAASKNATGTILLESTSTLTCAGVITADQPLQISSQTQMTTVGSNIQFGTATLTTSSAFTLVPTYLRRNESIMQSTATMSVVATKIARTGAQATSNASASITTNNSRLRGITCNQLAQFTQISNNKVLRLANANLVSTGTLFFVPGVLVRVEANLLCQGFVLSAGRVIHLDPLLTLTIEPETRMLTVVEETRLLQVEEETRVNKIKGYPL